MNDRQKQALELLLKGYSCADVGDELGIPAKHIHRTLDQIIKKLNKTKYT
jgi:DNA-binding NarL/FixJ family response regulator